MGGPGLLSTNLKSDEAQNRMLDTLMIICYVRTHLYQKGNLWDLMIFKSEIAVTAYLPSGWTPYDMHKFLEPSIEHQHYRQYRAQVGNEFPQSKKWTFCPVCSATAGESSDSAAVKFRCGFGECEDVYTNWDDLWEHQVSQGHARCPTEEYAPTTQNQETEAQRLNDDEAC
ncbi:hypothetical protein B0T10DRAFT_481138 [Thelonectria olida]|uniref:C2H2-type domain-containing protein n=1 Tax=Thelonectria olida TaxID=1576542 RepID=A0A9P8W9G5_9HYPO|nr:hypothetical protein B0T10DRAFT_481138 [Thelonectria olida]